MPGVVAVSVIFLGAGATSLGLVFTRVDTPNEQAPHVELEPIGTSERPAGDEVHGVVRDPDGKAEDGVRVDLVPLFTDGGAKRRRTHTDDEGRFDFTRVDITPGTPYILDARFEGATFSSAVLRFGNTQRDPVRIVVAPTTKRDGDISLDVESIALVGDAQGLQAVHALTVRNRGDRAYVGGLHLPLLPGANAIDPRDGLDRRKLELRDGEMVSLSPIAPGRHDITYTYVASMPRRGLRVRQRIGYETGRFELLVGGELTASGVKGIAPTGKVRLGPPGQEREYERFEAEDLGARRTVSALVAVGQGSSLLRIAGLIAAGVAAAGIVAFPLVRRRRRPSPPSHEPQPVSVD